MGEITPDQIKHALARVMVSDEFRSSETRSRFLQYVVNETLEGRADQIKGYSIAIDVYGRDADFDPQTDPVVRVGASQLRRDLEHYYLTAGSDDEIRFVIPKGRYVPSFERNAPDDPSAVSISTEADAVGALDPQQAAQTRQRRHLARWVVFGGFAVVLAAAGIGWFAIYDEGSVGRQTPPQAASVVGPAVYVVPFDAVSASSDEQPLAKGITIEIVNVLSQFVELQVYPVGPTFRASELSGDGPKGSKLGFVLRGSVQLNGDGVRITARLQRADDGLQVWSERYDSVYSPDLIFDIQEKIAASVGRKLAEPFGLLRKFSRRQMTRRHDPSLDAYKCVLVAYEYRRRFTPELHKTARACLERTVKSDPDYSRAWALLAHLIVDEYRFFYNERPNARTRAVEAARRAIKLNPDDVLSHQALSLALFHSGNIHEALDAARNAVALNPYNMEALLQLGAHIAITGGWEEGFALAQKAVDESPTSPSWFQLMAALYYYHQRDYEKAKVAAERVGLKNRVLPEAIRAMIYGQLGLHQKAQESLANGQRIDPEFESRVREYFLVYQIEDKELDHFMEGIYMAGFKRP